MSALQIAVLSDRIATLIQGSTTSEGRNFAEMLSLQHQLNSLGRIGVPEYLAEGHPWHYAIFGESDEAMGHVGWTWWKGWKAHDFESYGAYLKRHLPQNDKAMQQAAIEWIDQLHFALSLVLQGGADENFVLRCRVALNGGLTYGRTRGVKQGEVNLVFLRRATMRIAGIVSHIDLNYGVDVDECQWPDVFPSDLKQSVEDSLHVIGKALGALGVTADALYNTYVQKNVLNAFRWRDHRYQKGSYIKFWGGEEDCVHLQRFADEHAKLAEDVSLVDYLNSKLEQRYAEAVKAGDPVMSAGQ